MSILAILIVAVPPIEMAELADQFGVELDTGDLESGSKPRAGLRRPVMALQRNRGRQRRRPVGACPPADARLE